ncbi:MAG TPA: hypothetical protein VF710_12360 [Longimicrobium sp.]|jgi:hypothetical protein
MKGPRIYIAYGLGVLALLAWVEYTGYSMASVTEAQDGTPRSVRDNPGANRPIYGGSGRYVGGK